GDGSLYTGIALDVARRVEQHARGKGAKYTRGRGPFRVVAVSRAMTKSDALKLELRAKKLAREERAQAIRARARRSAASSEPRRKLKPRRPLPAARPRSRSARR